METRGEEGVRALVVTREIVRGLYPKAAGIPDVSDDLFIFPFKYGAGAVDE